MPKRASDLALDVGLQLVSAGILAVIIWGFNALAAIPNVPTWSLVVGATFATLTVAYGAGSVLHHRATVRSKKALDDLQTKNLDLNGQVSALTRSLIELRDVNRAVAEQLLTHIAPDAFSYVSRYVVALDKRDRIETEWLVRFPDTQPGHLFYVEEMSTYPVGETRCQCSADAGTFVMPVTIVDEPTWKKLAVYLAPPVTSAGRTVTVRHDWPDLWRDLRENGKDYIEVRAREGLKEARIQVMIPETLGKFEWEPTTDTRMRLSSHKSGAQQVLELFVPTPTPGLQYKAHLRRVP